MCSINGTLEQGEFQCVWRVGLRQKFMGCTIEPISVGAPEGPECKALKRSVRGQERKAQKVTEGRPSGLREKVVKEVRSMQCRRMCA